MVASIPVFSKHDLILALKKPHGASILPWNGCVSVEILVSTVLDWKLASLLLGVLPEQVNESP